MSQLAKVVTVITLVISAYTTQASPTHFTDSLVIRFANRTRMVIYAPDKAGIQALSNYDLNKIVREMGMKLDSVPGGQTAISKNGQRYLRDTVLIVTKRKEGVNITINSQGDTIVTTSRDDNQSDRDYQRIKRQRSRHEGNTIDYGVSVGLSNFIQQGANVAYPEDSYDLRPLGSRYIAFSLGATPTLIRGKYASLKLYYGVEVAWYNFMFEGNNYIEKNTIDTRVTFPDAGRTLQKSKMTLCTIGVPVVPRVTFYNSNGRRLGHVGLGGYVNYRLDSYRKIKEADGHKERIHSDYYLNNIRYGLMAQLGIRSIEFFVKYDLNPLFMDNKGPDVRTITFGFGF